MAHDVFVSYCSADKALADAVCAKLEASHVRCWIAPRNVLAGTEYADSIVSAIQGCKVFVLVFSSGANASPHVRRELERAVSKGKVVLPLRTEDVTPSGTFEYCLSNTHWLDAITPPIEERLRELRETVSLLLSGGIDASSHVGQASRTGGAHNDEQWGWMVVLALGYAAFVHVSAKASGFSDEKYRGVLDLVEDPMAPLDLEVKLPNRRECNLNTVSRAGHRIEGGLAKKGQRLARGFSFLWRVSLLLGATDDATEASAPEPEQQQTLASTLTEAAAEAGLLDEFCKELIHDIAFSKPDTIRKENLKEGFESWAFRQSRE